MKKIVKEKTTTLKCKNIEEYGAFYTFYTHDIPTEKQIQENHNKIVGISHHHKYKSLGETFISIVEQLDDYKTSYDEKMKLYKTTVYYNLLICEV